MEVALAGVESGASTAAVASPWGTAASNEFAPGVAVPVGFEPVNIGAARPASR